MLGQQVDGLLLRVLGCRGPGSPLAGAEPLAGPAASFPEEVWGQGGAEGHRGECKINKLQAEIQLGSPHRGRRRAEGGLLTALPPRPGHRRPTGSRC